MPEPHREDEGISLEEWENYCHSTLPASHRWSASEGLCLSCTRAYAKQEKTYFIGWLEAWCKSLLGIPSYLKPGYPPVGMHSLITAVGHQRDALLAAEMAVSRANEAKHLGHYRSACCVAVDEIAAALAALKKETRDA